MINLLVVENPVVNGVTWWRFFRPFAEIQRQFPGWFNFKFTRKIDAADAFLSDVVILSRPNDPDTLEYVKRIKDLGRSKIILDIDDAITNLPINHHQSAYHNNRIPIAREIFGLTDYFWVSTEQLLYECDCIGRGEIIPNAIYEQDLPSEPSPDRGLWMWRGKGIQEHDVLLAGAEVYEQIKDLPTQWLFWGILPILDHGSNVRLIEYEEDVQSYFAKLKNLHLNGVWKPLVRNSFNDAKSNIAWIEATMSGGVCLTNYAGETAWENAVSEFPDYDHAREVWAASRLRILEDFNLVAIARQRAESIERVLNNRISQI